MDATVLRDTYERLAAIAEAGHIKLPSGEQWSAELVVAHAIATNRTLVLLGIQILDGRDASYAGGTLSVRSAWLESIIQSTGNFAGLASIGLPLAGGPLVQAAGFPALAVVGVLLVIGPTILAMRLTEPRPGQHAHPLPA